MFVAALFWLIRPSESPTNLNNQEPAAVTAIQVDKSETEPATQRVKQKPVTPEPVGETATAETKVAISPPLPQPEPQPLTDKEQLMQEAGIPQSEWNATDYIVSHESSWNPMAVNASTGATGLCQALPASKMASVAGDYLTNPVTQLKWCHEYANSRYGSWWASFAFWQSNRWW